MQKVQEVSTREDLIKRTMFPRKILLRSPIWQKNLTKKPNMTRKKLLRTARYREKVESENH